MAAELWGCTDLVRRMHNRSPILFSSLVEGDEDEDLAVRSSVIWEVLSWLSIKFSGLPDLGFAACSWLSALLPQLPLPWDSLLSKWVPLWDISCVSWAWALLLLVFLIQGLSAMPPRRVALTGGEASSPLWVWGRGATLPDSGLSLFGSCPSWCFVWAPVCLLLSLKMEVLVDNMFYFKSVLREGSGGKNAFIFLFWHTQRNLFYFPELFLLWTEF